MSFKDIFIVLKRAFWDIIKGAFKGFLIKLNKRQKRIQKLFIKKLKNTKIAKKT